MQCDRRGPGRDPVRERGTDSPTSQTHVEVLGGLCGGMGAEAQGTEGTLGDTGVLAPSTHHFTGMVSLRWLELVSSPGAMLSLPAAGV